jgi:cyclophilin family peptidyl-prolyl cis-trans isomerase
MDRMAEESDVGVKATALANLWRFGEAVWEPYAISAATASDPQIRRAAAYSLARSRRSTVRVALRQLAFDQHPVIRATAVAGLGGDVLGSADLAVITGAVSDDDWRVQAAACGVLAAQPQPTLPKEPAAKVAELMNSIQPQLAVMAVEAARARPEIGSAATLQRIAESGEPWLANAALAALAERDPDEASRIATAWLSDGGRAQRRAVAAVAVRLGVEFTEASVGDPDAAVRLAWIEALDPSPASDQLEALKTMVSGDDDPAVRAAALEALARAGFSLGYNQLLGFASQWRPDGMPDARATALELALGLAADDEQRELVLKTAQADPHPVVAIDVTNRARELGFAVRSPVREPRHSGKWYLNLLSWMQGQHWLDVVTDRGTFRIRLESMETPITAKEIFDLAAAGFYDGLLFHRVVPNFVVQGGDPRGDGWGGPGFILPDEPSFRPFDSWRVGVATSGPNTGGCQLFVTLMPTDKLVGHFTNMGEVVAGREVLSRLRVGDSIRRVEAVSGSEPPPLTPVLVGVLGWNELAELPGWQQSYDDADLDPTSVEQLGSAGGSYRIVSIAGTWCADSRREVPKLVRVLDLLDSSVFEHTIVGVDRTRRIDDPRLAASLGVERTAERVATIVVLDADGVELGRVVETAERPIEELLIDFLAPSEGW